MLLRHECRALLVIALGLASSFVLCAAQEPVSRDFPHYFDFALAEKAGVDRNHEPVRLEFELPPAAADAGAIVLWNKSRADREAVQLEPADNTRHFRVLLLASQAAGSTVSYRLYYGGRLKPAQPVPALKVSGEPLAWKVENSYLIADFSPNPGTGKSGQLNKIFLKEPAVWLTRERDQSTLHLSPNAAGTEHYVPVNRWDPPEKWHIHQGPLSFRLERESPMPKLYGLRARVVYEVFNESTTIAVEEHIQAVQDVALSLLRVGELTLVPDPKNPFTHLAWGSGTSEFILMSRQEVPPLPLDAPWMAFISAKPSFAMASVLESIQYLPVAKPPTLRDSAARFSGQPPHYLFRTFIATETNNAKSLANLKAGDTYSICHWIYCPTSHDDSAEALAQRISLFAKGARKGNRLLVSR